ncbi:MAG: YCF48-related protein, partial [Ignavibacteria bacterium]
MKIILSVTVLFFMFSFFTLPDTILAQGFNSITTPDGINLIAVGNSGKIYRSSNGGVTYISFTFGAQNFNYAASLGNDVWFVGQNGNTYKTSKTNAPINIYNTGSSSNMNSIVFVNANAGFVCGDNGEVYKSINGGVNWSLSNSGISSVKLNSVSFRDANNGIVVGNNGSIFATSDGGNSWSPQSSGTTNNLLKVRSISPVNDSAVAVGENGTLLMNSGSGWMAIASRIRTDITGLSGSNISDIHISGGGGFIRNNRSGSDKFYNFEQNPMMANLVDIFYYDNNKGWAVSSLNSVIIYTSNGGANWSMPSGATVGSAWVRKLTASGGIGNNLCEHPADRNTMFVTYGSTVYVSR